MATIKLNIGDPQSKKTKQLELDDQQSVALRGKKLAEQFKGELIDRPGYEFLITGGSDFAGFPLRKDVDGEQRRKVLIVTGVGNRARRKGMRLRCTVAGNTITTSTIQVNVKIAKHGSKALWEEAPKEEKKEA